MAEITIQPVVSAEGGIEQVQDEEFDSFFSALNELAALRQNPNTGKGAISLPQELPIGGLTYPRPVLQLTFPAPDSSLVHLNLTNAGQLVASSAVAIQRRVVLFQPPQTLPDGSPERSLTLPVWTELIRIATSQVKLRRTPTSGQKPE